MTKTILVATLLLTSCASATKMGQPGRYLVECDGAAVRLAKCYGKAAELCPNGYDVLNQERSNGPATGAYAGAVASFGAMEHKSIVVQCK